MPVWPQTLSNVPMNGTTRCPHCETRFKITDAQLAAYQGMVRCGHCMQSFDARPKFIPDQSSPQLDQLIDELGIEEALAAAEPGELPEKYEEAATGAITSPVDQPEHQAEAVAEITGATAGEAEEPLDFSQLALTQPEQIDVGESMPDETEPVNDHMPQMLDEQVEREVVRYDHTVTHKRRAWPWAVGALILAVLLVAQSAYFFRVSLAAHLPVLKPALVGYCHILRCSVSLPQQSELMSIESSGLEAAPDHENEITFSALLRNRASYALAFPVLALTLNDDQDKPMARRLFMPTDYLPADESLQTGFAANHEVSIKLRLNTADLRPVGYRLELFYRQP